MHAWTRISRGLSYWAVTLPARIHLVCWIGLDWFRLMGRSHLSHGPQPWGPSATTLRLPPRLPAHSRTRHFGLDWCRLRLKLPNGSGPGFSPLPCISHGALQKPHRRLRRDQHRGSAGARHFLADDDIDSAPGVLQRPKTETTDTAVCAIKNHTSNTQDKLSKFRALLVRIVIMYWFAHGFVHTWKF